MAKKLSHVGPDGAARMVDVREKPATHRIAVAEAELAMKAGTMRLILKGKNPKGSVLEVSRIAGINAAKQTASLIPLCHPLALTRIGVEFDVRSKTRLRITSRVEAVDRTG